jgi:8-oxo-dGTP pyrophosphatase MutT (NUDIX family)
MSNSTEKIHLGAYAWLMNPTNDGTIFFGVHPEDAGKQERIPNSELFSEWVSLLAGMFCMIGGGVEDGEHADMRTTIVRESFEERGLPLTLNRISNGLPIVRVEQRKVNKPGTVVFDAVGHKVTLTEAELVYLKNKYPSITIATIALPDFLETEGPKILRPYVYIAAQRILAEGLLQQGATE